MRLAATGSRPIANPSCQQFDRLEDEWQLDTTEIKFKAAVRMESEYVTLHAGGVDGRCGSGTMMADRCFHRETNMVITLGPDLDAALNEVARRQGVRPEVLALEALRAQFLSPIRADELPDEWVRRLRQVATDCGVPLSDAAVSSEGIYE